jgi:hypothetical protein
MVDEQQELAVAGNGDLELETVAREEPGLGRVFGLWIEVVDVRADVADLDIAEDAHVDLPEVARVDQERVAVLTLQVISLNRREGKQALHLLQAGEVREVRLVVRRRFRS